MEARRKLAAVRQRLGEPRIQKGDEYVFVCIGRPGQPCPSAAQDKTKLSVNIAKDWFNCWVCGFSGKNLAPLMRPGSPERREYLESVKDAPRTPVDKKRPRCYTLPKEFTPLDRRAPPSAAPYRNYLFRRGLTETKLGLYRIGYADSGEYAGRVIVPSFDANGCVNFFSTRTIHPDVRPGYILPDCTKDVVSNEHMVDWSQPVYLVEGIFDEIAIGSQGIALYGKTIHTELLMRLMDKRPPITYVCLDDDARREALALVERLVGYDIRTALVDLPGKDPGELGGKAVMEISSECKPVTGSAGLAGVRL